MSKDQAISRLAVDHGALEVLVRCWQEHHGLDVDGHPGPATMASLGAAAPAVPIPRTRAEVLAVYGEFAWSLGAGRSIRIAPRWVGANIRGYRLHTGRVVQLHRLVGDEFVRLFADACDASGYTPASVQTWVPRRFKADHASPLSMHSWGIAADCDPTDNPWGGVRRDGSPSLMRQHMAFVAAFELAGWTWGGRWDAGKGDDMHFERRAPR